MVNEYWHITYDDKVYDADGSYIWHKDIVYWGKRWWMTANNDSEAVSNAQPSKNMNSWSATIDWANPASPSTNNATRREQYNIWKEAQNMQNLMSGWTPTANIYDSNTTQPSSTQSSATSQMQNLMSGWTTKQWLDLTPKGNFDVYQPIDRENQPESMQQYYLQANNDLRNTKRALSQLILQQDALGNKSSNVNEVSTLIDAIENAYDKGIYDTNTIANQLWVSPEAVSLVQQGKANELVKLNQEYVDEQLREFYRKEQDYDIQMQRTMEDYQLAKTNMDHQYDSAMQTLKRNLFDSKRASSVWSAVAGISGSEYALQVIEAKHNQALDDLNNNYLYSSMTQKLSYTRAIEDYNKNIERLSQDFDTSLKEIQAGVLQQFQEIDSKIWLTTQQLANIYWTLQQNVLSAKTNAVSSYMSALSNWETTLANAIAQITWLETSQFTNQTTQWWFTYNPMSSASLQWWMNQFIANLWDKIENHAKIRSGWCGTVVNDYLKSLWYWTPIGDSKSSKLALINNNTPTVWSVAIRNKTWTEAGNKYWHVAIVTWVSEDWKTVTVLESNADTWLRYHTYNTANITWYFDPSQWYWAFEQQIQQERLQAIYDQQAAKEFAKTTAQTTWESTQRDYSWLTNEQIADVDKIATEILWSTQASKDVATHNAIAQMMRDGKTNSQIRKEMKDREFWNTLNAYPETKAITQFLWLSLTKAQKEDFQDSIKDAILNNNPQEAFSFIKTTLKDQMDSDQKKNTRATELLIQHAEEIEKLYNEYVANWWETSWLSGKYEQFLQKFWTTSDPKLLELQNKISRSIMTFRKDISGAAFTESEKEDYNKVFPWIDQDMKTFLWNITAVKDLAKKDNEYYYDSMLWWTGKYKALQEELSKVRTTNPTITEQIAKTNQINLSSLKDFASNVYTMLTKNKRKDTDSIVAEETPSVTEEQVTSEFGVWWRIGRWWTISSWTTYTGTFASHF